MTSIDLTPGSFTKVEPSSADRVVAFLAAIAVGTHLALGGPLSLTAVVCVALLPIWAPVANRVFGPAVPLLGLAAVANGVLLGALSANTHDVTIKLAVNQITLVVELVLSIGLLVWVREILGASTMATLFGFGLLLGQATRGFNDANPWKFSLSIPVTVILLGLAWCTRRYRTELVALVMLAAVSAALDSRAAASICLTAFLLLGLQRARASLQVRSTGARVAASALAIALITYFAMQAFILDGFLGASTRSRTEVQELGSGSVILGGRPEIAATIALLTSTPAGFGFGVIPLLSNINVAKTGMASIGYDPNNGYVEGYMLGGGFEVHSIIGDFWLDAGIFGLALVLTLIVLVMWGASTQLAADAGRALTTFLALQALWDAFFSPLALVGVQVLTLAVALLAYHGRPPSGVSGDSD